MTARSAQATNAVGSAAEEIVLGLCRVLVGEGKDKGLMPRTVNGTRHLQSCAIGQWLQAGDCMRGGQPCLDRCQAVHAALRAASIWLKTHERTETRQPTLFDAAAS